MPVAQDSSAGKDAAKESEQRTHKVAVAVKANVQDGPGEVVSSSRPVGLVSARSGVWDPEAVNVPTLLDAAAIAWQTRRAPAASRHENRYTSGTTVQYLNQSFVDKIFSGVLKVDVLRVTHPRGPLHPRLSQRSGIRVTLKDKFKQAIAGYHSDDDKGRGSAFLWLHKGEEVATSTSIMFEHVRAGNRAKLAENPEVKTLSQADLVINTQIPTSPPEKFRVVLKAGDRDEAELEVAVSFVPLQMASREGDDIRQNIDQGAHMFSLDDIEAVAAAEAPPAPQGIRLGKLPSFRDCTSDVLYMSAFNLGLLFDGGLFQHGRGAEPIAFIENKATRTELVVFWNKELKQIAIAFDSTRTNVTQDIITNAQILPVIFDESGEKDGERFRSWIRFFRRQRGADTQLVHGGFLSAWRSVQFATDTLIRQAIGMKDGERLSDCPWKTIFTGYSLGGALATLATASAVANGRENQQLSLYTFGGPRVGNGKFLEAIYAKVPERLRVFNQADSVAYVPRSTGFEATAPAFCLIPTTKEDGTLDVQFSFPDRELPITVVPGKPVDDEVKQANMLPHVGVNNMWDRVTFESGLLWNLASRRGIRAHKTERYLLHLLTLTNDVALEAPGLSSKENNDLRKGLEEVKRLLEQYTADPQCQGKKNKSE